MRLIDADALPKEISWDKIENAAFWETINEQPTIDAVPVIRCANCKYYSTETEQTSIPNMRRCTWWRNIGVFPIDFCSRAERRGEE
jgi:hypothetical protein